MYGKQLKLAWKEKTIFKKVIAYSISVANVSAGKGINCYTVEMLWRKTLLFKSILCYHLLPISSLGRKRKATWEEIGKAV